MIAPMKKVTIVVQSKDLEAALARLGEAGVLHLEHQRVPADESINQYKDRLTSLEKVLEILPDTPKAEPAPEDVEKLINQVLERVHEREILIENLKELKKEIEIWKEWGDFDLGTLRSLRDNKIFVHLCKLSKPEFEGRWGDFTLELLFQKGNVYYCAVISEKDVVLPFRTLPVPQQGLKDMQAGVENEEKRIDEIGLELEKIGQYRRAFVALRISLRSYIEFREARAGAGIFKSLAYLIGYCPVESVKLLEKLSDKYEWGLSIEDPETYDKVPTLIKNPRWISIIRPFFGLIRTVPGYWESDISLWFLIFFSVFFGILIGDAGYGLIFLAVNIICHLKFKNKVKDPAIFVLIYVLSFCALIWGVLSGTIFGQSWLASRVKPLLPALRDDAEIQFLCFVIGALHLSVAHIWRFIRKIPRLGALSELGWILLIWAANLLANYLILGHDFPVMGKWMLISGSFLIIFFSNIEKNIFKSVQLGVGEFLLHLTATFTDVVSYIRLFAVGAASIAVADSFNQIAMSSGQSHFLAGFFTALILFFGHALNIMLGALAVLVHGVRLNLLEFSSHLNVEWSGVEYNPFRGEGK
jgi:V/A-type H+-transporting ATPase subunit I